MAEQIRDRGVVPGDRRLWGVAFSEYAPVDVGLVRGVVDEPDDSREVGWSARATSALVPFEVIDGVPFNPGGRTGRVGRDAKRWGENACADALVVAGTGADTRALLVRRGDCGAWAIPGGGMDPGEGPVETALRELGEETGVVISPESDGVRLYDLGSMLCGDPRDTDHAWYATTLVVILIPEPVSARGADDAIDAQWVPAESLPDLLVALPGVLYEAHYRLLDEAFMFVEALERLPETVLADRARLVHALRVGARGEQATEAAVELLIQHGIWLDRPEFAELVRLVDPNPDGWVQTAVVAWDQVGGMDRYAASVSEQVVLRIAVSLAIGARVDLSEVSGLDAVGLRLVMGAITHAATGSDSARFGGLREWWA